LDAPFPLPLAELLTDGTLRSLIEAGHIETDGAQAWLVDTGTLRLAAARCADPTAQHARIAAQWSQLPPARQDAAAIARHTLRAGLPAGTALQAAAQAALRAGVPAEADRWLQLLDLTAPGSVDFLTDVAHAWAALSQRPEDVDPKSIAQLRERAADAEQEAMAEALALMFLARRGDRSEAVVTGKALAARFSEPMPHLAAEILREVAAAELAMGQARGAVVSGREALALVEQPVPSRRDVEIADTLAAALLADSRPAEAVGLCSQLAARCFGAKLWWGEATARVWLGRGQLCLGLRAEAADNTARAQRLQPRHSDPALLARSKLLQARLAIERGDLRTGRADLDVARSTARALGAEEVLSEACALSLDVALHLADPEEARLAIADHAALSRPGRTDHWPAALGRWLWLSGDLHGALEAVRVSPEGHGALCVRAEQSRLLLVSGRYDEASRAAGALARRASSLDMEELALFGRLVAGAAIGARDTRYLPLLVRIDRSRWIHLHLGGLHFDAIRRRIRGEDVTAILRTLQGRAERIQHRLYLALSQPEGW
ncbi:MAG: tetratricopeptide (TPR) repeat protein, partial [Myxococcota bacterium]